MPIVGLDLKYRYIDGLTPLLEDYSWWIDLIKRIGKKADIFELRCWPEEPEAIETGRRFGKQMENTVTRELVFRGPVTEDFLNHVCGEGRRGDGTLKYFTLIFYKEDKDILSSEHYGAEPYISVDTVEEIHEIERWRKNYPAITGIRVHC